ncbi:hypothetical protein [Actinokineospora sp. HUAS TT18]|uniref:hypothetical protein n=1 Tax=Actinokineospora sp. HUAS TT18 TaxID=3447451 RepID=UPI003F52190D
MRTRFARWIVESFPPGYVMTILMGVYAGLRQDDAPVLLWAAIVMGALVAWVRVNPRVRRILIGLGPLAAGCVLLVLADAPSTLIVLTVAAAAVLAVTELEPGRGHAGIAVLAAVAAVSWAGPWALLAGLPVVALIWALMESGGRSDRVLFSAAAGAVFGAALFLV